MVDKTQWNSMWDGFRFLGGAKGFETGDMLDSSLRLGLVNSYN